MAENVGHEVIEGVRELLPVLRDRAQEAEDGRAVPADSIKALEGTGFFRLLQPATFGGYEADPMTFYTAVRLVASACGSTGWVSSVLGVHPWHLGLFTAQAQQEVWGTDQSTRISSSYAPTGKAVKTDGGHQVSGRWSFSSGCDHASWVFLGQIVTDADNRPTDFRTFLLPRSDYAIDDVWDTVGLRGTGSNDIVVADVVRARAPLAELHGRVQARGARPGTEHRAAVQAALRLGVLLRHHHADHRHGDRSLRGARHLPARASPGRLRRAEGRAGPVRPGPGRRGRGRDRRSVAGAGARTWPT